MMHVVPDVLARHVGHNAILERLFPIWRSAPHLHQIRASANLMISSHLLIPSSL
jgi:hypothetical protein